MRRMERQGLGCFDDVDFSTLVTEAQRCSPPVIYIKIHHRYEDVLARCTYIAGLRAKQARQHDHHLSQVSS